MTLRTKREQFGMTQAEVAERVGIPQPTYARIENGTLRVPNPEPRRGRSGGEIVEYAHRTGDRPATGLIWFVRGRTLGPD